MFVHCSFFFFKKRAKYKSYKIPSIDLSNPYTRLKIFGSTIEWEKMIRFIHYLPWS